jgi:hypothetical protein
VAGHAGRHRHGQAFGLAIEQQPDFFVHVMRHGDGAAQGDLFFAEPAHHGVLHIPVVIGQHGIDDALQLYALRRQFGPQLAVEDGARGQRPVQPEQIGRAAGEG